MSKIPIILSFCVLNHFDEKHKQQLNTEPGRRVIKPLLPVTFTNAWSERHWGRWALLPRLRFGYKRSRHYVVYSNIARVFLQTPIVLILLETSNSNLLLCKLFLWTLSWNRGIIILSVFLFTVKSFVLIRKVTGLIQWAASEIFSQ